jgi:hypothetical protein
LRDGRVACPPIAWHLSAARWNERRGRTGDDMTDEAMKEHLLEQVADVHEHFVELMNARLPELSQREIELYLGVLGKLVVKLEEKNKPLRASAQELFAEVAAIVMTELGR